MAAVATGFRSKNMRGRERRPEVEPLAGNLLLGFSKAQLIELLRSYALEHCSAAAERDPTLWLAHIRERRAELLEMGLTK